MKWKVPDPEMDQRTWREVVQKDCQAHILNREDAMNHSGWMEADKGWLMMMTGVSG